MKTESSIESVQYH